MALPCALDQVAFSLAFLPSLLGDREVDCGQLLW